MSCENAYTITKLNMYLVEKNTMKESEVARTFIF